MTSFSQQTTKALLLQICLTRKSSDGNIIAFMNGNSESLALSLTSSRTLRVSASSWSLGTESNYSVPLNSWSHLRLQVSGTTLKVFADVAQVIGSNVAGGKLPVTGMRIGGAHSFFDEFVFRTNPQPAFVPSDPVQGILDLTKIGGFGTGADGVANLTSNAVTINTKGKIRSVSGVNVAMSTLYPANCCAKTFSPGDEVMFFVNNRSANKDHTLTGLYAFRRVISSDGLNIIIDSPVIEEFDLSAAASLCEVYAIRVPNFSQLTISNANFHYTYAQIVPIRCTCNVTFNSAGFTYGSLINRYDTFDLCHSDLTERIISSRGSLMIICGGTFTADSSSRLGTSYGHDKYRPAGYGAAAGYDNPVMIGSRNVSGENIFIAARKLRIDENALAYGARSAQDYSGLCYLAGDMS